MRNQMFESCWRQNLTHDCTNLHCTEPFIITLSRSRYDIYKVTPNHHFCIDPKCLKRYAITYTVDPDQTALCAGLGGSDAFTTGDQDAGLGGSVGWALDWWSGGCRFNPCRVGNVLLWRLIMKYFRRYLSPFCWFKKGSCQFLAKECAQYRLTTLRTKPAQ